jgi:hypothetical protein
MLIRIFRDFDGKWNWPNLWRLDFILLLCGFFFVCVGMPFTSRALAYPGMVLFLILFVVRLEDIWSLLCKIGDFLSENY